jgi:hypothetical protein
MTIAAAHQMALRATSHPAHVLDGINGHTGTAIIPIAGINSAQDDRAQMLANSKDPRCDE